MLGAEPRIGRVLSLFRHDCAICTSVAGFPDRLVAAVGTIDGMALVIALLGAENISVSLIDHCAVIEFDVFRVVISRCVVDSTFGFAIPVRAVDVFLETH